MTFGSDVETTTEAPETTPVVSCVDRHFAVISYDDSPFISSQKVNVVGADCADVGALGNKFEDGSASHIDMTTCCLPDGEYEIECVNSLSDDNLGWSGGSLFIEGQEVCTDGANKGSILCLGM